MIENEKLITYYPPLTPNLLAKSTSEQEIKYFGVREYSVTFIRELKSDSADACKLL